MNAIVTSRAAVVDAIRDGADGATAARQFGVSRERIRQIWVRETGEPLPTRERLRARTLARLAEPPTCKRCGESLAGPYWVHAKERGHNLDRMQSPMAERDAAIAARIREQPDRRVVDIAAEMGVSRETAFRAAEMHGIQRYKPRPAVVELRRRIVELARDPRQTRRSIAAVSGVTPDYVYYVLRVARKLSVGGTR